jgi:hypothetical protein
MQMAPYAADQRAQPHRNGQAHARAIITVWQPKGRGAPSRPPPMSPTTSTQQRLKRRAHYAQLRPRLRSFNGWVPYEARMTPPPHTVRAKSSKKLTL